jgi:succinate dehydrogenase/fumarate reductase-like Fe-S protein
MTERRTQCRLIETLRGEPLLVSCSPVRALQMFKCATCQIPEAVCSAAPVKTVYSGPGRLVEFRRYGVSRRRAELGERPDDARDRFAVGSR